MNDPRPRYLLFSDESGYSGSHQYRSIGVVSGLHQDMQELNSCLHNVLKQYEKTEIKFHKVNGGYVYYSIARKFIDIALKFCREDKLKIYVITWDTKDSRHKIAGRDDIENLKRMYYHILKTTIRHWNMDATWDFYPDQFSGIKWEELISYIEATNFHKFEQSSFELFQHSYKLGFPRFKNCRELESIKYPVIQLCDIFAGMIRVSRESGSVLVSWRNEKQNGLTLFPPEKELIISKSLKGRFEVIDYFKSQADRFRLNIGLDDSKYLKSYNIRNGLFFWQYCPQGDYDKAPN